MRILVGSQAMKHHFDNKVDAPDVKVKDTDYFSDHEKGSLDDLGMRVEVFWDDRLKEYDWAEDADNGGSGIATLDELYTIKVSHAFWNLRNGSWGKHMSHMMQMKEQGAQFIDDLYNVLYPIWVDRHGRKLANLEIENPDDFFKNTVERKYDHDSIHASVAYYDEPLFKKILRDGHAIAVSKEKFDALSYEDKVKLVKEEIFATSLERDLIPQGSSDKWRIVYQNHLNKLITSYSKGWFPLWVVLHFEEFCRNRENYWDRMMENKHRLVLLDTDNNNENVKH